MWHATDRVTCLVLLTDARKRQQSTEEIVDQKLQVEEVYRRARSERQRQCWRLIQEGNNLKEVAAIMGLTRATIKHLVRQGLQGWIGGR